APARRPGLAARPQPVRKLPTPPYPRRCPMKEAMPLKELYFAYGSNLNLGQMAVRCPMAQLVCRAVLEGYELAFRCGVLTILPKEGGRIDGILWKVNDRDERALDRYEGYPHLYTKESLTVQTDKIGRAHV